MQGTARFEPVDKTGFAELSLRNGVWYAVESEHLALQIYGTISSSSGSSATCSVTTYNNGVSPGSSGVTVVDVSGDTLTAGLAYECISTGTAGLIISIG